MKFKTYTFSLLVLLLISCKEKTKKENPNFDFNKTFVGKIDNKSPLHIKLNSDNGKISGTYFYDKVGSDIEIKGVISNDSTVIINEFDQTGNQTGLWNGKLVNENKINGTWSKPNGDSKKEFTLILTSDNYESSKKAITDIKFSKYNGTYNKPYNEGGMAYGQVIIKYHENQEIGFEITVATYSGCTGEVKGIAKINSNGMAKYSGSNCESLTFDFKNDKVSIEENNCELHGVSCSFSGTYEK